MNSVHSSDARRPAAWIVGLTLVALSAATTGGIAVSHPYFCPDFCRYAVTSQEIAAGNGIKERISWLVESPALPDARGAVPMVEQPPVFPILLAALGGAEFDRLWPAKLLAMASLIGIALLTAFIGKSWMGPIWGTLAGCLIAVLFPLYLMVNWMISEPVFMIQALGLIACLIVSRQAPRPLPWRWAASLLAGTLFSTRYIGIVGIAALGWECLRIFYFEGFKRALKAGAQMLPFPLIMIALMFTRTYSVVGNMRGVTALSAGHTWKQAIGGVLELFLGQFDVYGLKGMALIGVLFAVAAASAAMNPEARRVLAGAWLRGLDVVLIFFAAYAVVLTQGMKVYQPIFEHRFGTPMTPLMILLGVLMICLGFAKWPGGGQASPKRIAFSAASAVAALPLFWVAFPGQYRDPSQKQGANVLEDLATKNTTFLWLAGHKQENGLVVANSAYELAFFAGIPSMWLPSRAYVKNEPMPEDMRAAVTERMRKIGSHRLALLGGREGLKEKDFGAYIAGLSRRVEDPGVFKIIHEDADGVVYELQPGSAPAAAAATR